MEILYKVFKRAEKNKNRIIIPKFIIEKFGRDFYIEVMSDNTIRLTPVNQNKEEK